MNCKRFIGLSLFLFFGLVSYSFLEQTENPLDDPKAKKIVDPLNMDVAFLDNCILESINQKRVEYNRPEYKKSDALKRVCKAYQEEYKSRRFTNADRYERRINRGVLEKAEHIGYEGSLVESKVASLNALNYNGKEYFHDARDTTTELQLFYGERGDGYDQPIEKYTYRGLSQAVAKHFFQARGYKKTMKSRAFKDIGIACRLDYRSLHRKTIPQLKVLVILGGNQTDLLKELMND